MIVRCHPRLAGAVVRLRVRDALILRPVVVLRKSLRGRSASHATGLR